MDSDEMFIFNQQLHTNRRFRTGMTKTDADDLVVPSG